MLYFDLDGVMRDLAATTYGYNPDTYHELINGKFFADYVNDNIDVLITAPKTEFADVILSMHKKHNKTLNIMSYQNESWINNTDKWISENLKGPEILVTYTKSTIEKLSLLGPNDILVEDYPFFDDYSKIVLINHKYNQNANAGLRIKTAVDIEMFLSAYFSMDNDK